VTLPADEHPAGRTGALLVRSGAEIGESLEAMRADGDLLTASVQEGQFLFLSRLLRVAEAERAIVVACSELRQANHALLASASAVFSCNRQGSHFEFVAGQPHEIEFAGATAIQLSFPTSLIVQQRRAHPRLMVPTRVPLKCVVEWGALRFDASIVDISRKGVGTLLYETGIQIEPGTRLPRVRIEHPRRAVMVGLEVRHAKRISLPDGRQAMHAGCRLIGAHHDLDDLIQLFMTELE
jgi:c-di-GMP-binding flagellar brake protein YcgR